MEGCGEHYHLPRGTNFLYLLNGKPLTVEDGVHR